MSWIQLSTEFDLKTVVGKIPAFEGGEWVDDGTYRRAVAGIGTLVGVPDTDECCLSGFGLSNVGVSINLLLDDKWPSDAARDYLGLVLAQSVVVLGVSGFGWSLQFAYKLVWTDDTVFLSGTPREFEAVRSLHSGHAVVDFDSHDQAEWPWLRDGREPGAFMEEQEFASIAKRLSTTAEASTITALLESYQDWEEFPMYMTTSGTSPGFFDGVCHDRSNLEWYAHLAIEHGEFLFVRELNRRLARLDEAFRALTEPDHEGLNLHDVITREEPVSLEQPSHWWLRRKPLDEALLAEMIERFGEEEVDRGERAKPVVHPFNESGLRRPRKSDG